MRRLESAGQTVTRPSLAWCRTNNLLAPASFVWGELPRPLGYVFAFAEHLAWLVCRQESPLQSLPRERADVMKFLPARRLLPVSAFSSLRHRRVLQPGVTLQPEFPYRSRHPKSASGLSFGNLLNFPKQHSQMGPSQAQPGPNLAQLGPNRGPHGMLLGSGRYKLRITIS